MMSSSVLLSNAPYSTEAACAMPLGASGRFATPSPRRPSFTLPSSIPEEIPVSVQVSGTTFLGVYGIVGDMVELMSPDFGEAVTAMGAGLAQSVAEQLLRSLAGQAIESTDIPFMQDHRSGAGF